MQFLEEDKRYLLKIAREAISYYLKYEEKYIVNDVPEHLNKPLGVFVTLLKNGELRGCIGYPYPIVPLAQAVADNAINAAFFDPRFEPLSKDELNKIKIEITVLTLPEEIKYKNPEDLLNKIEIGRDGLIIEYGGYSGLLLPQVPVEYGWNKSEYLSHACLKAGLPGDIWKREKIKVKTFQGIIISE